MVSPQQSTFNPGSSTLRNTFRTRSDVTLVTSWPALSSFLFVWGKKNPGLLDMEFAQSRWNSWSLLSCWRSILPCFISVERLLLRGAKVSILLQLLFL